MKAVTALLAVCAAALCFIAYQGMDPTYELGYDIDGQRYIVDHDLSLGDCYDAMRTRPTFSCYASR